MIINYRSPSIDYSIPMDGYTFYTCAIITDGRRIILVNKNRPEWQKDKLNFIGGKQEDIDNDKIFKTFSREVKEETNLDIDYINIIGTEINHEDKSTVIFGYTLLSPKELEKAKTMTDEQIGIYDIAKLPHHVMYNIVHYINITLKSLFKTSKEPINSYNRLDQLKRLFSKGISDLGFDFVVKALDKSEVQTYLNIYNLDMRKHLDDVDRWKWFNNEISEDYKNKQIFIIGTFEKEIIFTISYTQYLEENTDVYSEYMEKFLPNIPMEECIITRTLVVNPKYRNLGIGKTLNSIGDDYWLKEFSAIICSTSNVGAIELYKNNGYDMDYEDESWYWFFKKLSKRDN